MIWLKENWFKLVLTVSVVVVLGLVFYWYEFRTAQAKKECTKKATEAVRGNDYSIDTGVKAYDFVYENCLRQKGL